MTTLTDLLNNHAASRPNQTALIDADGSLTYAQLRQTVLRRADQLNAEAGNNPYIPLRMTATRQTIADYLAIHCTTRVCVPMPSHATDQQLEEQKQQMHAAGFTLPPDTADILFTTGTTGEAKGVMVSHSAIQAEAENLTEAQGYTPATTFIANGPLNHIGTLSKLYPTLLTGGTFSLVDGLKDLSLFFAAVRAAKGEGRTLATFLVPTSARLLMTLAEDEIKALAHRFDFIETGAAPMTQTDMEHLCTLFPTTRLYNTYASTETGIISTYDFQTNPTIEGCLGQPMRHSSLTISADGRVAASGKTLMLGYWNDPERTLSVLHAGTLHTADCGTIDAQGNLHLTGRADDIINVGGYKVNPLDVERIVHTCPGVSDCLLVPGHHPIAGTVLRLIIVKSNNFDRKQFIAHLRSSLPPHSLPQQIEFTDAIQRTFNGKPDRKFYRT